MKQTCPDCGNNPVPHWLYWYQESLNIWLTPLRQRLIFNPLNLWIKRSAWGEQVAELMLALAKFFRMITVQSDVAKCQVRRAQVLWEEASLRGLSMSELKLFGKSFDTYVVAWPSPSSRRMIFSGLPRPRKRVNPLLDLMDDKLWLKEKFMPAGLPVPAGGAATNLRQAKEIFSRLNKPVIVKPRAGSRGRHSSTYVFSDDDLAKAFFSAKRLCYWVIIEEQLTGPVYRATVINGHLAGVLRGDSPQVSGDGRSSIAELVKQKNLQRSAKVSQISLDAEAAKFLQRQGLNFSSVPKAGQQVSLSEKIGVGYGGSSSEDFEICHQDNKRLFLSAAELLQDSIVGFDFIIPNISQSYRQQRCGFIEANSLPFINLHHDPLYGRPRNAAALVWEMMEHEAWNIKH